MMRWTAAAIAAGLLLAVYLLTLPPSLTWAHYGADGGDLAAAVVRGSIPHPPGSPAYLLLGELFVRLPLPNGWGDPAWRLNLMSAVLAAGAAALTTRNLEFGIRNSESRTRNSEFAICAALCLGLAPLFWSQAIVTELYAPTALFAALVTYLALRGGPAWALGLAWGAGLGVHPTLLFLAPVVVWGAWRGQRRGGAPAPALQAGALEEGRRGGRSPTSALQAGVAALLGWGVLYGPVLVARGDVPSPWGDVSTFEGWWALVSGRLYHGYLFGLPLAAWPQRLLAWAGLLARQFTPVGAVLAGLGWVHLCERRRALAVVSALSFGAFSLYAVGYDTADSLVFLVPALPLAALWLGAGLKWAAVWLEARVRWGAALLFLLPLLQALLFWGQINLRGERAAMAWAGRMLEEAPPRAAILTAQDAHTFTLWYVHDALGERPDVVVVDCDMWGQQRYRGLVASALGLASADADLSPEEAARLAGRPVVYTDDSVAGGKTP